MRQVAGSLRLDLAQYRELAAFAQFGSDLDKATLNQLNRGRRLVEVLKQPQYQPLPVEKQVAIIYAADNGYLDSVDVEHVRAYETEPLPVPRDAADRSCCRRSPRRSRSTTTLKAELNDALTEFGKQFAAGRKTRRRSHELDAELKFRATAGTNDACRHYSISAGASARSSRRSRSRRR